MISLYFLHNSIYRCHFNWLTEEVTYSWLQVHSIVSHLIVYGSEIIHDPALPPIEDLHLVVREHDAPEVVIPLAKLLVQLGKYLNLKFPDLARMQQDLITR